MHLASNKEIVCTLYLSTSVTLVIAAFLLKISQAGMCRCKAINLLKQTWKLEIKINSGKSWLHSHCCNERCQRSIISFSDHRMGKEHLNTGCRTHSRCSFNPPHSISPPSPYASCHTAQDMPTVFTSYLRNAGKRTIISPGTGLWWAWHGYSSCGTPPALKRELMGWVVPWLKCYLKYSQPIMECLNFIPVLLPIPASG